MIAANYRKFPDAMALQLVLLFGRCTWHTGRPTQRAARAVRAARNELVKATPQLVRWVKKATPEWFKQAKRKARDLANQVRAAIDVFVWELMEIKDPAAAAPADNRLCELMKVKKPNTQMFWFPMGNAKYQTWVNVGMWKMLIKPCTSLAYRD